MVSMPNFGALWMLWTSQLMNRVAGPLETLHMTGHLEIQTEVEKMMV